MNKAQGDVGVSYSGTSHVSAEELGLSPWLSELPEVGLPPRLC